MEDGGVENTIEKRSAFGGEEAKYIILQSDIRVAKQKLGHPLSFRRPSCLVIILLLRKKIVVVWCLIASSLNLRDIRLKYV